jgi:hypothetical protein
MHFSKFKLSVVFYPEAFNGRVGLAKEFCQFSSPVHGLLLDFDHFGYIRRDHVIHGPDVASWFQLEEIAELSRFIIADQITDFIDMLDVLPVHKIITR